MAYFSGQGKVYAAVRDGSGNPTVFKYFGNVPELKVGLNTDVLEHKESVSGNRLTDQRITKENKASVDLSLEEFTTDNLSLALYGTKATVTSAVGTTTTLPTPVVAGDFVRLGHPNVSNLAIATAVLHTDYELESADHGLVRCLTAVPGGKVATYDHGAYTNVTMFTSSSQERWLRFEGLNTADGGKKVLVELYRVIFDPMKDFALIMDELAKWALSGSCMYDATKALDATLGGFGRVLILS